MPPALSRVLTLFVAATLALLLQPVRAARANEGHAGLGRTQDVEVAANSPRRSTISERGLDRRGDATDQHDHGWLDECPTFALSDVVARMRWARAPGVLVRAPHPAASARGPPR